MRQGAYAISDYQNLGKSTSLCASVHFSPNVSRFGAEPRGSSGEMPFVVSCALLTSRRAGMPVTALPGTWAEAGAGFMFSVLWQLLALCISRAEPALLCSAVGLQDCSSQWNWSSCLWPSPALALIYPFPSNPRGCKRDPGKGRKQLLMRREKVKQ